MPGWVISNYVYVYQSDLFQQMHDEEQEEKDGVDAVEHYLRALRKKVEHQVRNPFDLAFASFTFEELATWKNNVLQLDATSRLYGQRVDFLHCGALQILGSVLNSETAVQSTVDQRQEIRKEDIRDNSPFERHLEQPAKLNSTVERFQINSVLWRQICKKRDALHQLMLNELPVDCQLSLVLNTSQTHPNSARYQNLINGEENSIYLKLLDFQKLSIKFLSIYKQMEEAASDVNLFMVSFSGGHKVRGENFKMESWMQFDFQCLQQPIDEAFGIQMDQNIKYPDASPLLEVNMEIQVPEEETVSEFSSFDQSQDYFQMDEWGGQGQKRAKAKRKHKDGKESRTEREALKRQRLKQMVDFKGMQLERERIFLPQSQQILEKYLNNRDFLLLRFVKYNHPVVKKQRKTAGSKFKPLPDQMITGMEISAFEPETCQPSNNEAFGSWNPITSFVSQQRVFKEAALPIKQMKRRIKDKLVLDQNRRISFQQIRDTFSNEQPLDIFISVLHIAAEQQAMICV